METLVYEDSPLADYLEGMTLWMQLPWSVWRSLTTHLGAGKGEGEEDWATQEVERPIQSPIEPSPLNFAPTGRPRLQDRLRNKLPAPLQLNTLGKREAFAKLHAAYSV